MSKAIVLVTGIFLCLAFLPVFPDTASAIQAVSAPSGQAGVSSSGTVSTSSNRREVVNIVVDRIEDNCIYAKDGRSFQITNSATVIRNIHSDTSIRTAELIFDSKTLVCVILR